MLKKASLINSSFVFRAENLKLISSSLVVALRKQTCVLKVLFRLLAAKLNSRDYSFFSRCKTELDEMTFGFRVSEINLRLGDLVPFSCRKEILECLRCCS